MIAPLALYILSYSSCLTNQGLKVYNKIYGGVAEWTKAAVLKTVVPRERDQGFESSLLRHCQSSQKPAGHFLDEWMNRMGINFIYKETHLYWLSFI